MSNRLKEVLIATLCIIFGLFLLSYIPEFSVGNFTFKPFSLFSDIQKDSEQVVEGEPTKSKKDCPPHLTCWEDYTDSTSARSSIFWKSLRHDSLQKNPVRIAFFGDSFIEGDIFCANFRDTLQGVFGGKGVGFVPITSPVAHLRISINHRFSGFQTSDVLSPRPIQPLGAGGFCFVPTAGNTLKFSPSKADSSFKNIRLFYTTAGNAQLKFTLNSNHSETINLIPSSKMSVWTLKNNNISSFEVKFTQFSALKLYGFSFEDDLGVYVDNFSLRGHSGFGLSSISQKTNYEFNAYQDYKLIILQYGLNVMTTRMTEKHLDWYYSHMKKTIEYVKKSFPKTPILLLSVPDRSTREAGKFVTMKVLPKMVQTQRKLAKDTKIMFWDMYNGMGGHNSMVAYANTKPLLANKDYTHLTHLGGKHVAHIFAKTLFFEKNQFEKNNPN